MKITVFVCVGAMGLFWLGLFLLRKTQLTQESRIENCSSGPGKRKSGRRTRFVKNKVDTMTEQWIMYAGIAVWIGIGLYAAFIAVKQAALTRKIETLELLGGHGRDRG